MEVDATLTDCRSIGGVAHSYCGLWILRRCLCLYGLDPDVDEAS